jgi:hypothetical protein
MKHFSFVTHPRLRLGVLCAAILCAGGASYAGGLQLRYSSYAREGNYRVDWGYGIACSAAGHIGITGSFNLPDTRLGVILLKGSLPSNTLYASYFGANDSAMGSNMAFDRQTNVWLTGSARGTTFYVTPNAYQPTNAGPLGTWDAVVMKIDPRRPTGNGSVLYSTYLGGSGSPDYGQAIAVDKQGNAYVAGFVYSTNLRTTPNAYQTTNAGPPNTYEAMFAKFDSTGGVVFVSYLGGLSHDKAHGIAVDDSGNIYVMGATQSANFPVTANAYQSTKGAGWDLFLTKFDSTGRNMLYS